MLTVLMMVFFFLLLFFVSLLRMHILFSVHILLLLKFLFNSIVVVFANGAVPFHSAPFARACWVQNLTSEADPRVCTTLWSEPALVRGGSWRQSPLSYRCRARRDTSCLLSPFVLYRFEQLSAALALWRGRLYCVVLRVPQRVVGVPLVVVALPAAA